MPRMCLYPTTNCILTSVYRAIAMLTKRRSPHDSYDMYAKALSVLQLLVRQAPSLRHGFRAHVKAFFVPQGNKDLGSGLIARRGFFQ